MAMALPTMRSSNRISSPAALIQAKLDLLETFLSPRADVLACSQAACEWLRRNAGVARSLCAVLDSTRGHLVGVAGHGIPVENIRHRAFFAGHSDRHLVRSGAAQWVPCHLGDIPAILRQLHFWLPSWS